MQNEKLNMVLSWTVVLSENSITVLFYVKFQTFLSAKYNILGNYF